MKQKRITAFLLALLLALVSFPAVSGLTPAAAAEAAGNRWNSYFYDQLEDSSKVFYDAILKMYREGILLTGHESFELTGEGGPLSQEQAAGYMDGGNLLSVFGAARDAFYMDYPEVFYVDFSSLSIRTTLDSSGKYHVYIGSGRREDYFTPGFTQQSQAEAAVKEYEKAVGDVVQGAKALKAQEGESLVQKQVEYVHDRIIYNTSYKLEDDYKPEDDYKLGDGNIGFIRTAYGALVKGESACEGYARAVKSALDRLGIPCLLVYGVFRHSEDIQELHMWNYVQIDGKWYGVDATMDDPYPVSPNRDRAIERRKALLEELSGALPKDISLEDLAGDVTDGDVSGGDISGGDVSGGDEHRETKAADAPKDPVRIPAYMEVGSPDGYENHEYLMVGEAAMGRHHVPVGIVSEAQYEFSYPMTSQDDVGFETAYEGESGLTVKYSGNSEMEGLKAGEFRVSYNGMGPAEAAKQGIYFLARFLYMDEDGNYTNSVSNWGYILTDLYSSIRDMGTEVGLIMPQAEYAEFAVTDRAPGDYKKDPKYASFQGDPCLVLEQSGMLHNPSGTYKAPPYPKYITPSMSGRLSIGGTYHVEVVYDDQLVAVEGETPGVVLLDTTGTTAMQQAKLANFKWDGRSTVTFDFTPSVMWADDSVFYTLKIQGLVGRISGKAPLDLSYFAAHPCAVCAYKSQGFDWNVFGKPALIENEDLSVSGWKTSDGEPVSELLKHRMVLVASEATPAQAELMNDMIEEEGQKILKSQTYNISLTLCKKQVIETGQAVRISLGFPEGYGPEDAGVTFKAYHFTKDNTGEIVSVEEIPCVITPYGLLVYCHSFSPFAIVAVQDDAAETNKNKTVIVTNSEGGRVSGAENGMKVLSAGETGELSVTASSGYYIDSVTVNGEEQTVTSGSSDMSLKIAADQIQGSTAIVDVKFVASAVQKEETAKNEKVAVLPVPDPVADTNADPEPTAAPGEPTAAPGEPTVAPGEPAAAPAGPTAAPEPTGSPADPAPAPVPAPTQAPAPAAPSEGSDPGTGQTPADSSGQQAGIMPEPAAPTTVPNSEGHSAEPVYPQAIPLGTPAPDNGPDQSQTQEPQKQTSTLTSADQVMAPADMPVATFPPIGDVPGTNDNFDLLLWVLLLTASGLAVIFMVMRRLGK